MTTENLTSVKEAKAREQTALVELRQLTEEQGSIESRIKAAIRNDAEASLEAARAGQSPLTVDKTAPALINRSQELEYLVPVANERYQEEHRDTLRATVEEAHAALQARNAERDKAEANALPYTEALNAARTEAGAAAQRHRWAQDAVLRAR